MSRLELNMDNNKGGYQQLVELPYHTALEEYIGIITICIVNYQTHTNTCY